MPVGEIRPCTICKKEVEVVDEVRDGNVAHQKLSCGHPSERKIINVQEIVQSKDVTIQTVGGEGVPVRVSGSSGISQLFSFSGLQGTFNTTGQLVVNQQNISISNYSPHHIETTTITNVNNLQDIFSKIDKSDYSSEDKTKIKGVLSRVYDDLKSLGGIMPLATPFIPPIIKILTHSG